MHRFASAFSRRRLRGGGSWKEFSQAKLRALNPCNLKMRKWLIIKEAILRFMEMGRSGIQDFNAKNLRLNPSRNRRRRRYFFGVSKTNSSRRFLAHAVSSWPSTAEAFPAAPSVAASDPPRLLQLQTAARSRHRKRRADRSDDFNTRLRAPC